MLFVRGLSGEETRASAFHKGSSLFLPSLKTERGCRCTAPAGACGSAHPAPARSGQRTGRSCETGQDREGPLSFFRHLTDSLRHIPLPSRPGPPVFILPKGTGQFQREGAAGSAPVVSRGQPAQSPRPQRLPAHPQRGPANARGDSRDSWDTRDHATHPAAAELQVPKSFARRARGSLSHWGAGLAGARSVAGGMSSPASGRLRLARPGPALHAPRSPGSARRSPQSQRPRR